MTLAYPYALLLLALLPALAWLRRRATRGSSVPLPGSDLFRSAPVSWRIMFRWLPAALHYGSLTCLIVAIARPQESSGWTTTSTEGIAMQIVVDRSGSMREPMGSNEGDQSKMDVARRTLISFVKGDGAALRGRMGDMIGLIAFARYADTLSPMARAHEPLVETIKRIEPAQVRAEDGTAIGDALALAAARLKRAEEELLRSTPKSGAKADFTIKSKVIVLMTDGENNCGDVSPYEAAKQAKQWGIRLYTIGVGAGDRVMTVNTPFGPRQMPGGSGVDEKLLRDIATDTGGEYLSADSPESLAAAYAAIDRLETSRIDATQHTAHIELFAPWGIASASLVAIELLLSATLLRRAL